MSVSQRERPIPALADQRNCGAVMVMTVKCMVYIMVHYVMMKND